MLVSRVVVGFSVQMQVRVGGSPVHGVSQGAVWSSVYVGVQERKVAVQLCLYAELVVGVNIVEMVK
jgi:hypothetical protein